MNFVTEREWEWQEQLKAQGYHLVAPTEGTYRKRSDAEEVARQYPDSYVICHTYCGRGCGYMVYSK